MVDSHQRSQISVFALSLSCQGEEKNIWELMQEHWLCAAHLRLPPLYLLPYSGGNDSCFHGSPDWWVPPVGLLRRWEKQKRVTFLNQRVSPEFDQKNSQFYFKTSTGEAGGAVCTWPTRGQDVHIKFLMVNTFKRWRQQQQKKIICIKQWRDYKIDNFKQNFNVCLTFPTQLVTFHYSLRKCKKIFQAPDICIVYMDKRKMGIILTYTP